MQPRLLATLHQNHTSIIQPAALFVPNFLELNLQLAAFCALDLVSMPAFHVLLRNVRCDWLAKAIGGTMHFGPVLIGLVSLLAAGGGCCRCGASFRHCVLLQ